MASAFCHGRRWPGTSWRVNMSGAAHPPRKRAGSQKDLYQWVSANYTKLDRNWRTIDTVVRITKEIGATPN
jgi:aryl-alcohol dehydrogenase (NADP+)